MNTITKSKNRVYLTLDSLREMSDEEFEKFSLKNSPYQFEKLADGTIIMMEPTVTYSGLFNSNINLEIGNWNRKTKLGYVFDSSTGFKLPNGDIRSPDASFVLKERWEALTEKEKNSFAPLCPDFVIELTSPSDDLEELHEKMQLYMINDCHLGWLIDIKNKKVFIYRSPFKFVVVEGFDKKLSGEPVLPGFELDLRKMRGEY